VTPPRGPHGPRMVGPSLSLPLLLLLLFLPIVHSTPPSKVDHSVGRRIPLRRAPVSSLPQWASELHRPRPPVSGHGVPVAAERPTAFTLSGLLFLAGGSLAAAVRLWARRGHRLAPGDARFIAISGREHLRRLRIKQAKEKPPPPRDLSMPQSDDLGDNPLHEYDTAQQIELKEELQAYVKICEHGEPSEFPYEYPIPVPGSVSWGDQDPALQEGFFLGYNEEKWDDDEEQGEEGEDGGSTEDIRFPDAVSQEDLADPIYELFDANAREEHFAEHDDLFGTVDPEAWSGFLERVLDENTPPDWRLDRLGYSRDSPLARILLANRLMHRMRWTRFQVVSLTDAPEGDGELVFERSAGPFVTMRIRSGIGVVSGRKTILPDLEAPLQVELVHASPALPAEALLLPVIRPKCHGTILCVVNRVSRVVRRMAAAVDNAHPCVACGAPFLPGPSACPVCGCVAITADMTEGEIHAAQRAGQAKQLAATVTGVLTAEGFAETTGTEVVTGVPEGARTFARDVPDTDFYVLVAANLDDEAFMFLLVRPVYRHPHRGPLVLGRSYAVRFAHDVGVEWVARKTRTAATIVTTRITVGARRRRCRKCGSPTYKTRSGRRACVTGCRQRMSPAKKRRTDRRRGREAELRQKRTWRGYLERRLGLDFSDVPLWEDEDAHYEDVFNFVFPT
jgi:hypothetical protein